MLYVFQDTRTGELLRRELDGLTADQMREYIRDGFRLLYVKLADAAPLVRVQ